MSYTALPLRIKSSEGSAAVVDGVKTAKHYIFFREHTSKNSELPKKRTLFVLNPPLGAAAALEDTFGSCGTIEGVHVSNLASTGELNAATTVKCAYIVFKEHKALKRALQLDPAVERELLLPSEGEYGLARWTREYESARPDPDDLLKQIDSDLLAFDEAKSKELARLLALHGTTDDDGWTMVTKGGGKEKIDEGAELETGAGGKFKKPKKERELQNFYVFQRKDAKKEQIAELRRKFDLDKARVEKLKATRSFRPF